MIKFFSIFLFFQEILLWLLLLGSNKSKTNNEKFLEDNLQMEYLKKYQNEKIFQVIKNQK